MTSPADVSKYIVQCDTVREPLRLMTSTSHSSAGLNYTFLQLTHTQSSIFVLVGHRARNGLGFLRINQVFPPASSTWKKMLTRLAQRVCWRLPVISANPPRDARRQLNTVLTCPEATCECSETPSMPEEYPIDHKGNINGLISNYAQQVLICTGKDDWSSRIEDDNDGDNLAADLKELVGRGGMFSDVS